MWGGSRFDGCHTPLRPEFRSEENVTCDTPFSLGRRLPPPPEFRSEGGKTILSTTCTLQSADIAPCGYHSARWLRSERSQCLYGLIQRVPLHPQPRPDLVHRLLCSSCMNWSDDQHQTSTVVPAERHSPYMLGEGAAVISRASKA